MKVLLVGGGGREHAIGWKLARSSRLDALISAPGNPGLAELGAVVPHLDVTDADAVTRLAAANGVDLVVIGPEAPLAAGVVDGLAAAGILALGPTAAGARLEASKAYAKQVMAAAGVPTAASRAVTEVTEAVAELARRTPPYVVKADGLAAGKGVLVTADLGAAERWARRCIEGGFGDAGKTVVIEDHLEGPELSVIALCDGERAVALPPARDYKRLGDGDTGPNTGGMGCYSPVALPPGLVGDVMRTVIDPVVAALGDGGVPYRGFLYAGIVLTAEGPKVLEFNCRLGDPEAQVVLPRLDEDLVDLLAAAAAGRLDDRPLRTVDRTAVDVVLAAPGYPEAPETGGEITGVGDAAGDETLVFHAGTARRSGSLVAGGGRVLNVVGLGDGLRAATRRAYGAARRIEFAGKQFRSDIGDPS